MTARPVRPARPSTRLRVGFWLTLPAPLIGERLARLGFDYLCVDLQHGVIDYHDSLAILTALSTTDVTALVRVPSNEPWWIGKALDAGAHGVIVPMVDSADDAARAVRASRYPPDGSRSYGPLRARLYVGPAPHDTNAQVSCIPMIETLQGLSNVESIAAAPGVNALYVGPSDLAIALGLEPGVDEGEPAFEAALQRILAAGVQAGIPVGIQCSGAESAKRHAAAGFDWVTISSDIGLLAAAAESSIQSLREATDAPEDWADSPY